jgi:hypothetical protein
MLACMSGHERGANEWEELFKKANSRYKFLSAAPAPNSKMWLIEAEWTGWRMAANGNLRAYEHFLNSQARCGSGNFFQSLPKDI